MGNYTFNGKQLNKIRVINHKTLEDVSACLRVTKQCIQNFENGIRKPDENKVSALCDFFGVKKDFFYLNNTFNVEFEQINFRRRKIIPQYLLKEFSYKIDFLLEIISFLKNKINFIENKINYFNNDNIVIDDYIENIVTKIKDSWNLKNNIPTLNISRLLENRGCMILSLDDIVNKIDACSFYNEELPLIFVNKINKENICRTRFSICHELGHLILHRGIETGDFITENQANKFASEFLLPKQAFLQEFDFISDKIRFDKKLENKLLEKKYRWGVSFAFMFKKAFDLNMINYATYEKTSIYLKKSGQGILEHGDNKLDIRETNTFFINAIELLENNNLVDELCNFLHIKNLSFIETLINRKIINNNNIIKLF